MTFQNRKQFFLQIIKIISAVIILFVICWTPVKTKQIIRSYFRNFFYICSMKSYYLVTTITLSFHWLAMAHSFVNPIIYSFMSKSFRVSLNLLLNTLNESDYSSGGILISYTFVVYRNATEALNTIV
jgi:hypothetical protein